MAELANTFPRIYAHRGQAHINTGNIRNYDENISHEDTKTQRDRKKYYKKPSCLRVLVAKKLGGTNERRFFTLEF